MPGPESSNEKVARRRSPWLIPIALIVLAVAAVSWSFRPDHTPTPVRQDGGIIVEFPIADRAEVAAIKGRQIDGGYFDSADVAGKIVVYNVWGSWCGPCRKEAPDLKRLSDELRAKGVRFVGLDVKDDDASAVAFERNFRITYASIGTADSGEALLALSGAVPLGAVPTTVVVDREGRVAARIVGISTYYTLKGLVEDVLAETP